jgi:hypothetical protein
MVATEHIAISFLAPGRIGPVRATAKRLRVGEHDGVAEVKVVDLGRTAASWPSLRSRCGFSGTFENRAHPSTPIDTCRYQRILGCPDRRTEGESRRCMSARESSMPVDVTTAVEILRPRGEVADFAMDPINATIWYKNIGAVHLEAPGPIVVGSKMEFQANFLGRSLAYTYEVKELKAGRRLVMRTFDGPFPMETTYEFEDADSGGTKVRLRNRGEPVGFSRLVAPFMAPAMRRANREDLKRLKAVLEAPGN